MASPFNAAVAERASTRWDAVLSGVRAEALDCLQSTVAAVADEAHGSGTHLALGSRWRFPSRGADGTVGVQPSVAERMAQAEEVLGIAVGQPQGPAGPAELRRLAGAGPVYVVAEAYDLQWLPYSRATVRYREMPHSFLIEQTGSGYTVVDAYYADTEWGRARPHAWTMEASELDKAVQGKGIAIRMTAGPPPAPDHASAMRENAIAAREAGPVIEEYLDTARETLYQPEGIERLVLDIWHLCRERLLATIWLGEHEAATAAERTAHAWQQLAAQSYLASRRARRGARPNLALIDDMGTLLRADAALLAELGGAPTAAIENTVRQVLGSTLGLAPESLRMDSTLRTLPGFDSFRLVEIIDRLEGQLGLGFPADVPAADLADVAGLCRVFTRAARTEAR